MSKQSLGKVLVVEDESAMRELLAEQLTKRGFEVKSSEGAEQALRFAAETDFSAILTDLNLKGMNGIELCRKAVQNRPDIPVLVITAFGSLESAIQAIRAGAWDFITKPVEMETLGIAIERAVKHHALREEVKRLRHQADAIAPAHELLGDSEAVRKVQQLIGRVADSDASVLITGESGTGKEVVARALHRLSRRKDGPFIAVNCAAMPEALLESELFGHVKGAFTDAKSDRVGMFKQADGGTLLLDEVGELPLTLQPKLLRALQERKVRPVGGSNEMNFDARIIAATNVDLDERVEEGRFRDDLFYRLNVIQIVLPPLRARGNDVLELAQHFVRKVSERSGKRVRGLTPAVAQKLLEYDWPGNVRELENCIERSVAFTAFDHLQLDDLPEKVRSGPTRSNGGSNPEELTLPLEVVERRHILRVLDAQKGNRTRAAKVLGLDRKTLYRKLERWGMHSNSED